MIRRLIPSLLILLTVTVYSGWPGIVLGQQVATEPNPQPLQARSRRFEALLTLNTLQDLLIQEGSVLEAGQVIVEKTPDPKLLAQIIQLETDLEAVEPDPPDFFAEFKLKQTQLEQVRGQYMKQLDLVHQVEATDVSPKTQREQRGELERLHEEFDLLRTQAELAHTEGTRRWQLHQDQAEQEKRRIQNEIEALRVEIREAQVVAAAVSGQVESIRVVGQRDHHIEVEVVIR